MNSIPEHSPSTVMAVVRSRSASSQAILYVEDDAALRSLLVELLSTSGYRVDVAGDGQEGWEALHLGSYDLLITDNEMPRLSGLDLVRRLRSSGHTLPVVMASGAFSAEDVRRDQSLQVAATLRKPFTPRELLDTVEEVLRGAPGKKRSDIFVPVLAGGFVPNKPARHWDVNE